jgi:predicted secreted protein
MAVINGTVLILSSEGIDIAYQKGVTITVEQDLPDATNKESGGWAQHINGMLNAKIDFNSLFSSSALPAMSAKDLMDYILNRESLLITILGLGYPIVGQADMNSLSFDAPQEGVMGLSGGLKVNGQIYVLSGTMANMITDPDSGGTDYDHHDESGTAFTSLINDAGSAYANSNAISVANTGVYKFVTFLTLNSGELPKVGLWDNTSAYISNNPSLVAGLNIVTLTATATDATASLRITNTGTSDMVTTPIYLFKV